MFKVFVSLFVLVVCVFLVSGCASTQPQDPLDQRAMLAINNASIAQVAAYEAELIAQGQQPLTEKQRSDYVVAAQARYIADARNRIVDKEVNKTVKDSTGASVTSTFRRAKKENHRNGVKYNYNK